MRENGDKDVRKRIAFDAATFDALRQLALDRTATLQELADEAFRDLLAKHHRPVGVRAMLQASVRPAPDDAPPAARSISRRR